MRVEACYVLFRPDRAGNHGTCSIVTQVLPNGSGHCNMGIWARGGSGLRGAGLLSMQTLQIKDVGVNNVGCSQGTADATL